MREYGCQGSRRSKDVGEVEGHSYRLSGTGIS